MKLDSKPYAERSRSVSSILRSRTGHAVDSSRVKNYPFVGSQTGSRAAAIAYILIETAKLNAIDLQA